MSVQDEPNQPSGEDPSDRDVEKGWEQNWVDEGNPINWDPTTGRGWEKSYNQEIYGDERGGQVPKRPRGSRS